MCACVLGLKIFSWKTVTRLNKDWTSFVKISKKGSLIVYEANSGSNKWPNCTSVSTIVVVNLCFMWLTEGIPAWTGEVRASDRLLNLPSHRNSAGRPRWCSSYFCPWCWGTQSASMHPWLYASYPKPFPCRCWCYERRGLLLPVVQCQIGVALTKIWMVYTCTCS
jgi:hypothetical protein